MKLPTAPVRVFVAMACCILAACSPPREEKRGMRPSQPEETSPSPPPIDPWKVAEDWPVPEGPVGDAQRFLLHAPAYQCTSDGEDLRTHEKNHGEGKVVRYAAAANESAGAHGRSGMISDGKREFVFYQGRYIEENGDAAATLADLLKHVSLQALLDASDQHTPFLGPGKVDGVDAEQYALTARPDRPAQAWSADGGHLWVWIAREDHRPLKVEWKENRRDPKNPGEMHTNVETRIYHYDPNAKVPFPAP